MIQLFVILIVLAVIALCELRRREQFRAKYPRISDEEFMEKLPPGTNRDIALKTREIIARQMGVERERIHPETKFTDLID